MPSYTTTCLSAPAPAPALSSAAVVGTALADLAPAANAASSAFTSASVTVSSRLTHTEAAETRRRFMFFFSAAATMAAAAGVATCSVSKKAPAFATVKPSCARAKRETDDKNSVLRMVV